MIEILLGVSSMLLSGMAIVLVKKGIDAVTEEPDKNVLKTAWRSLKNKYWFTGGTFLLFGWLLRFLSLMISDLSYVRMIYTAHLLVVIVGSKLLVKEKIGRKLIVTITVVLAGLVLVSLSPPLTRTGEPDLGNFLIFFAIMLIIFISAMILTAIAKGSRNFFFGISSASSFSLGAIMQALIAVNLFTFPALFTLDFYFSLLLEPLVYLMVGFSFCGFLFGNLMVVKFKLSLMYSISYPLSEVIVLIGSIVVFNEDLSLMTNGFRVAGIILMMVGLTITVYTQKDHLLHFPILKKEIGEARQESKGRKR